MKSIKEWLAPYEPLDPGFSKLAKAIQEDAWLDGVGCGTYLAAAAHDPCSAFQREFEKRFGVKKEP